MSGVQADEPKSATIVKKLLRTMGVKEYSQQVTNQLMDFMYQYFTEILKESEAYAVQAQDQSVSSVEISIGDMMLAIQSKASSNASQAPSLQILQQVAQQVNKHPLPSIKRRFGLRLPDEDQCLVNPNYQLQLDEEEYDLN
eukprot:TRINITY_DN1149_c1_g1_i3.p3 TRINITY_DN1149_c1_g1~~TRINITY_DN1149_c1_g1_i3.p3  ORF type:complete len:151 (+),score=23.94 TRINITY_DN1149_c1_g1_i3:32-454(+)